MWGEQWLRTKREKRETSDQKICNSSKYKLSGTRKIKDLNLGLCSRVASKPCSFLCCFQLVVSHDSPALWVHFPPQIPDIQTQPCGRGDQGHRLQRPCFPAGGWGSGMGMPPMYWDSQSSRIMLSSDVLARAGWAGRGRGREEDRKQDAHPPRDRWADESRMYSLGMGLAGALGLSPSPSHRRKVAWKTKGVFPQPLHPQSWAESIT